MEPRHSNSIHRIVVMWLLLFHMWETNLSYFGLNYYCLITAIMHGHCCIWRRLWLFRVCYQLNCRKSVRLSPVITLLYSVKNSMNCREWLLTWISERWKIISYSANTTTILSESARRTVYFSAEYRQFFAFNLKRPCKQFELNRTEMKPWNTHGTHIREINYSFAWNN